MKKDSLVIKRLKSVYEKVTNIIINICTLLLIVLLLYGIRRVFIAEQFRIPTESMIPSLFPGDKVWVNKTLFGGRIYKSFKFEDHAPLKCFRMPGIRKIRPGDVICFNYPHGYDDWWKIEFKINYVYCKRVLGTPGDRIGAVDGHYWNDKVLSPIGVLRSQEDLRWMYDSVFVWSNSYEVFPFSGLGWNIKNWGPLVVPSKDMTIEINDSNRELYRSVIEYETKSQLESQVTDYCFKDNYYFAVGDNAMNSNDSRYWGFIPEDFIIGIVGGKKVRNNPNQTSMEKGNQD